MRPWRRDDMTSLTDMKVKADRRMSGVQKVKDEAPPVPAEPAEPASHVDTQSSVPDLLVDSFSSPERSLRKRR